MELFFYSCEKEAPFETLYESLDSSSHKSLISNHKQHIAKFETYKDRILDEAIGDTITDKKILVPRVVKAIFLEWIKEKYGDDAKFEESVFNVKDFYLLGAADELNNFLKEMNVEEERESVVKSEELKSSLTKSSISSDNKLVPILVNSKKTTNHKIFLVGIGIVAIIISVFYFYDNESPSKEEYGQLTITTNCSDCEIYIKGKKQKQKTPVTKKNNMKVSAGNNIKIKLVAPKDKNAVDKCATITLLPNELKKLGNFHFQNCN